MLPLYVEEKPVDLSTLWRLLRGTQADTAMRHTQAFAQHPYRCRLEWGWRGAHEAAARQDILVVVDTLSFSTTAATIIQRGGLVYPCTRADEPTLVAQRVGGDAAVGRHEVPGKGLYSLSPLTYSRLQAGARIALYSPNGGALCLRHALAPYLLVGALVNAAAVAAAVARILTVTTRCVTVLACGERWPGATPAEMLRVAVEDFLGAGAILSCLPYEQSPEAQVCAGAFVQAQAHLPTLLQACGSGRELCDQGFADDVRHAAQLNVYDTVPNMMIDHLERL